MTLTANPTAQCKVCDRAFLRFRTTQAVCGPSCARKSVTATKKAEKDDTRARRLAIKPRSKWLAEAQQAFNAWVRARDALLPCVSCDRQHDGQWHAGHYLTAGARPELRFDPLNVHKQCQPCNVHLHGNLILYRVGLVARIGIEAVEALEGPHQPAKWSADELRCIRNGYRIMTKQLLEKA